MARRPDYLWLTITAANRAGGQSSFPFESGDLQLNLHLLSPANRKQLLQVCLARAWEEAFIGPMMPKRFDQYAKSLGWRVSGKHLVAKAKAAKRGFVRQNGVVIPVGPEVVNPNTWTGMTKAMVLSTARVKATGTASRARAQIVFDVPTYIKQQRGDIGRSITLNTLQTVTASEAKAVWVAFQREVVNESNWVRPSTEEGRHKMMPSRNAMAEFGTRTGTRRSIIQPRKSEAV